MLAVAEEEDEALLVEIADALAALAETAEARGELEKQRTDLPDHIVIELLDTVVQSAGPAAVQIRNRLLELLPSAAGVAWWSSSAPTRSQIQSRTRSRTRSGSGS
ncbi:hypothetical protein ACQP1U_01275 [Actinomycetota bacterium]